MNVKILCNDSLYGMRLREGLLMNYGSRINIVDRNEDILIKEEVVMCQYDGICLTITEEETGMEDSFYKYRPLGTLVARMESLLKKDDENSIIRGKITLMYGPNNNYKLDIMAKQLARDYAINEKTLLVRYQPFEGHYNKAIELGDESLSTLVLKEKEGKQNRYSDDILRAAIRTDEEYSELKGFTNPRHFIDVKEYFIKVIYGILRDSTFERIVLSMWEIPYELKLILPYVDELYGLKDMEDENHIIGEFRDYLIEEGLKGSNLSVKEIEVYE